MNYEIKSSHTVTLQEARVYFDTLYSTVSDIDKIRLKCWYYYCECRDSGGKEAMPYLEYINRVTLMDYVKLVRSYCIDVSDIGGVENALRLLVNYY